MNNRNQIIERALNLFPHLNFEEGDNDAQRFRLLIDFYSSYLMEFGVDVNSVLNVQINQPEISIGNDMISMINLKCSVQAVIPNHYLGLFDLLSPSRSTMLLKIDQALDFYDFSDDITSRVYELCDKFIKGKNNIKKHRKTITEKQNQIMELKLKLNTKNIRFEEINSDINDTEKVIDETIAERKSLENQIQQAIARNTILRREKKRIASLVEETKNDVEKRRKALLDRSVNCISKINNLEGELKQLIEEKYKCVEKRKEMNRSHKDLCKFKEELAQRLATSSTILNVIEKYNNLKECVQVSDTSCQAQSIIDDLNNKIANQIQETEKFKKSKSRELAAIKHDIAMTNSSIDDKKVILEDLKTKFKDVPSLKLKLEELDLKAKKISANYNLEVEKLKAKEEKLINKRKQILKRNEQLFTLEEKLKKLKNMKKD